jgi:hypothetical protein
MAYREIAMWEMWEVLRRVHRGEGQRAIQSTTGQGRTAIRRRVSCAMELGWQPAKQEPEEALARRVAERMQPIAVIRAPGESELQLEHHALRRLSSDSRLRGRIRTHARHVVCTRSKMGGSAMRPLTACV